MVRPRLICTVKSLHLFCSVQIQLHSKCSNPLPLSLSLHLTPQTLLHCLCLSLLSGGRVHPVWGALGLYIEVCYPLQIILYSAWIIWSLSFCRFVKYLIIDMEFQGEITMHKSLQCSVWNISNAIELNIFQGSLHLKIFFGQIFLPVLLAWTGFIHEVVLKGMGFICEILFKVWGSCVKYFSEFGFHMWSIFQTLEARIPHMKPILWRKKTSHMKPIPC